MVTENTKPHLIALVNGSLVLLEVCTRVRKPISSPSSVTAPAKGKEALHKSGAEL